MDNSSPVNFNKIQRLTLQTTKNPNPEFSNMAYHLLI